MLTLVLIALVTFATLRMPAALITVAALGLPLLFLLYLRETDAYHDLPVRTLVLTAGLGIALGVGWVLLTGAAVARSYGVPLGTGIAAGRLLRDGLGVPVGSMMLMLVPVVVVRLLRPPNRGVVGRLHDRRARRVDLHRRRDHTRLAPQFATGHGEPAPAR